MYRDNDSKKKFIIEKQEPSAALEFIQPFRFSIGDVLLLNLLAIPLGFTGWYAAHANTNTFMETYITSDDPNMQSELFGLPGFYLGFMCGIQLYGLFKTLCHLRQWSTLQNAAPTVPLHPNSIKAYVYKSDLKKSALWAILQSVCNQIKYLSLAFSPMFYRFFACLVEPDMDNHAAWSNCLALFFVILLYSACFEIPKDLKYMQQKWQTPNSVSLSQLPETKSRTCYLWSSLQSKKSADVHFYSNLMDDRFYFPSQLR